MHRLKIFFIGTKKKPSHYFSVAIENVKKYFTQVDIAYFLMNDNIVHNEKWIIVIVDQVPLHKIPPNFVDNFNKSFTLFIYLTSNYVPSTVEDAYEKEFDYVMNMKLTSPKNFSLFLRNLIVKRLEIKAKNQRMVIGNILVDIVSKRIWVDNEEHFLTSKEFDVLRLLLTNHNKYVSQSEIFEKVWKTKDFDRTRSVSQYIHRLKNKIGHSYFKSSTNYGYKIVVDLKN